ncbi:hexose kinase [uncultured Gilliamella sp.]|uniref:hexose kinase n=1 Tax=uncultured Gilliamella sp. TaxID=1193505 RepID=UPI0025D8FBB9|nr:hexose kinase [uncultured Gilliamella sp.]
MILTVTMNPSVDISYPLPKLLIDNVNRVVDVRKTAGGKGLNVTRGIHLAGYPVLATGIIGGSTGQYITKQLDSDNIRYDFYTTQYESRNCIAILHEGNQTEILEAGPELTAKEEEGFWHNYQTLIKQCKVITISGSLPRGFDIGYYAKMVEFATKCQIPVLLDTSGNALLTCLKSTNKPFLIKPNKEELSQLINQKIPANDINCLKHAINNSICKDVPIVVVSLGKDGCFVKYHDDFYQVSIPSIAVVNPVGSGDVTLGGLAISILQNEDVETMMKRAMTMGMLNAMEATTGFINMKNYEEYFQQVIVEKIN